MRRNYIRWRRPHYFYLPKCLFFVIVVIILIFPLKKLFEHDEPSQSETPINLVKTPHMRRLLHTWKSVQNKFNYTFQIFNEWNQTLCSQQSQKRGPHQKVIALSIYGITSKFTNNPMFAWNTTIMPYLAALSEEVNELLPSWIIRIYTDYVGSTPEQRERIQSYSNVDVCNVNDLPMFDSSLLTYMPGKMWRFLPVFDSYVDYTLSRDLDSPMTKRETETLNLWLAAGQENKFFYIARDHQQHTERILGGLWGAAPIRARHHLYELFRPMLMPEVAKFCEDGGDQLFLSVFIYENITQHSLSFDSFHCKTFGAQPFPSKRPDIYCFLGCYRPCCNGKPMNKTDVFVKICPFACRPKNHWNWIYC